jgi:hypothetical protein
MAGIRKKALAAPAREFEANSRRAPQPDDQQRGLGCLEDLAVMVSSGETVERARKGQKAAHFRVSRLTLIKRGALRDALNTN